MRVRLKRPVDGVPAGAEGRVVPHDVADRQANIVVDFGEHGTVRWHPPRKIKADGPAIRAARRQMLRDCVVLDAAPGQEAGTCRT